MTLSDINQKITNITGQSTGVYTNTQRIVDINIWYERAALAILRSQDDWNFDDKNKTDYPILTSNLVANQQDYILPTSILKIQRVEVTYDGTNWFKVEPFDINMRGTATSNSLIASDFAPQRPYYDLIGPSLFLYPIPTSNVTSGLKIWIARTITEFTVSDLSTGTSSPGIDIMFHPILAYGAAYEYAVAKNLTNVDRIKNTLEELMQELTIYYGRKDEDIVWSLNPAYKDYGTVNFQTGNIRRIQ